MEKHKLCLERRRHRRFPIDNEAFVTINSMRVGSIMDISRGGMLIRYSKEKGTAAPGAKLSIYAANLSGVFLRAVPCRVIHDRPERVVGDIEVRCCGIKFKELSQDQSEYLEYLLKIYSLQEL